MALNLIYFNLERLYRFAPQETIVQLTNDAGGDEIGEAVLNGVAERAATEIEVNFYEDYAIPISPVPPVIADLAAQLSLVYLWERRDAANVPDPIRALKADLQEQLKRLRQTGIPGAMLRDGGTKQEAYASKSASDRVFSKGFLDAFRQ